LLRTATGRERHSGTPPRPRGSPRKFEGRSVKCAGAALPIHGSRFGDSPHDPRRARDGALGCVSPGHRAPPGLARPHPIVPATTNVRGPTMREGAMRQTRSGQPLGRRSVSPGARLALAGPSSCPLPHGWGSPVAPDLTSYGRWASLPRNSQLLTRRRTPKGTSTAPSRSTAAATPAPHRRTTRRARSP